MTRFYKPHARRGEIDPPAGLVDLSKKMLGQLANRIKLNPAVKTLVLREDTPEGFVEARILNGLPQVFITKKGDKPINYVIVDGFFCRPTLIEYEVIRGIDGRIGTWWSEDTSNPDNSHIAMLALKLQASDAETLTSRWYSSTHIPVGSIARYYGGQFPEGLQKTANIDWTGDKGVVHFFGPENRYNSSADPFHNYVFHNGEVLLNFAEIINSSWRVMGAALHGELNLRIVVCQGFGNNFRVYRVPIKSMSKGYEGIPLHLHPRLAAVPADAELLAEFTLDGDAGYRHTLHFNQRGNECRGIFWRTRDGGIENYPYEVVISFSADAASVVMTNLPYSNTVTTSERTVSGSVTSDIGIDVYPNGEAFPYRPDLDDYMATGGRDAVDTVTVSEANWTKMFVDYRDNVPVYAEAKAKFGAGTTTTSRTVSASGTGYAYYDPLVHYWVGWTGGALPAFPAAEGSKDETITITITSGYSEGVRTDWCELLSTTTISSQVTRHAVTESLNDGVSDDQTRTATETRATTETINEVAPMYLDLRNKIAFYVENNTESVESAGVNETSGLSNNVFATGGATTDADITITVTRNAALNVNGVVVATDEVASSSTPSSSSTYAARVYNLNGDESSLQGIIVSPFSADGPSSVEEYNLVPYQVHFGQLRGRVDHFISAYPIYGSWAVVGDLIAYSQAIKPDSYDATPLMQRFGMCNKAGVPLSLTLPELTGADVAADYLRYFPISALSPFAIKR